MKRLCIFILISLLFPLSCGKLRGEFAFQTPLDKSYKIRQERLEFDSAEEIKWVYKFGGVPGSRIKLGVILMKKELGWVDILSMPDYIDEMKDMVYGTIRDLDPGDYRIVITEITEDTPVIIDQCDFYLFSDEEPLD